MAGSRERRRPQPKRQRTPVRIATQKAAKASLKPLREEVVAVMGASSGLGRGTGPPLRRAGREDRRLGQGRAGAPLVGGEHPARDLVVKDAAKAIILGERPSPRLLDALMQREVTRSTIRTSPSPRTPRITSTSPWKATTKRSKAPSATARTRGLTPGWRCARRRRGPRSWGRRWGRWPCCVRGRRI